MGGRESIILLEGSQTSPARTSSRSCMKMYVEDVRMLSVAASNKGSKILSRH